LAFLLRENVVMTKLFKILAVSLLVLGPASAAHAQISFGIRIGEPPAPRAYRVPPRPGPDYVWVEGYQYPENGRYVWHDGYWTRPPYQGAYWVDPYHVNGQYFQGQWEGDRANVAHDHRWDKSNQRDQGRQPGRDGRR
jgi:YXWGXW repeat-containing protein